MEKCLKDLAQKFSFHFYKAERGHSLKSVCPHLDKAYMLFHLVLPPANKHKKTSSANDMKCHVSFLSYLIPGDLGFCKYFYRVLESPV